MGIKIPHTLHHTVQKGDVKCTCLIGREMGKIWLIENTDKDSYPTL